MRQDDAQMLKEDEGLRQEDLKIAEQDSRLAEEDAEVRLKDSELRRRNARMRKMLEALEGGAGRGLLGKPAESEEFTPHQTKGWVFPFLTVSIFSLSIILFVAYKMHDFFYHSGVDLDGDGDIDFDDFKRQFSLGLSDKTLRQLGLAFLFAASGFAFLWWMGLMQPFLGQLAVYAYLLLTVAGFAAILIAEIWTNLSGSAQVLVDMVQRVERFFHSGVQNFGEAAKAMGLEAPTSEKR